MASAKRVCGLQGINTSESTYGVIRILNNKIIIPYYNVHIMPEYSQGWGHEINKYIDYCYIVFEGAIGIIWDYELSRHIEPADRNCYGGIYYFDDIDREFWIKHQGGFVQLRDNYKVSSDSWGEPSRKNDDFFLSSLTSELENDW